MRTSLSVIAALGSVGAAALAAAAGCGSLPDDCLLLLTCPTGGSGAGGGEPTPDVCIPSKNPGKPVDDACGIFVTSSAKGADGAIGSKNRPLKTLAAAVAKAKSEGRRPIYACAETFTEPVSVDAEVELYGGLDCDANWAYIGGLKKTTLTADADRIPLTLTKTTRVADFAIVAKDGMSAGQSSVAVVADQAKVSFERCEITAGIGAAGLPGATPETPVGPPKQTDLEIVGNDGQNASCSGTNPTLGGPQKKSMYCEGRTIGGYGGAGDKTLGTPGAAMTSVDEYTALGGMGQAASDATLDCSVDATANPKGGHGSNGSHGPPGSDGDGAKDDELGTLDASGFKGTDGKDGSDGQPGKGGGGGGGAKGKSGCFGASGGGGGVGGCGGGGGKGGGSGGSSIGIIGLTAQLTFDAVTIKVGDGGKGGDGGDGQPGGLGGRGGNGGVAGTAGSANACNGGDGGTGGNGGKGGGGRGGHSIGIAYTSVTDQEMPGVQISIGMAGVGGKGVDMSKSAVDGLQVPSQRWF